MASGSDGGEIRAGRTAHIVEWRAVATGGGVGLVAAVVGVAVPLPTVLWPVAVGVSLAVGFGCGFVAGRRSCGGWRSRTRAGGAAGVLGGVVFATVLWTSTNGVLPRADHSAFWVLNGLIATNPVGIERFPWLYTGTTLFWPLLAVFVCLFAIEGYVASGVTSRGKPVSMGPR